MSGTTSAPAAVGVAARASAARSHSGVSCSWPTAETIGTPDGSDRADDRLVAEGEEVLEAAASASEDDDVDLRMADELGERGDDRARGALPLHARLADRRPSPPGTGHRSSPRGRLAQRRRRRSGSRPRAERAAGGASAPSRTGLRRRACASAARARAGGHRARSARSSSPGVRAPPSARRSPRARRRGRSPPRRGRARGGRRSAARS